MRGVLKADHVTIHQDDTTLYVLYDILLVRFELGLETLLYGVRSKSITWFVKLERCAERIILLRLKDCCIMCMTLEHNAHAQQRSRVRTVAISRSKWPLETHADARNCIMPFVRMLIANLFSLNAASTVGQNSLNSLNHIRTPRE